MIIVFVSVSILTGMGLFPTGFRHYIGHRLYKIDEPLNLGSSELTTINNLVDMVEDIAGTKLKRTHNLKAPKGVNGRNSDNTRIQRLLGWAPSIRLRDGMEKTYAWIYDEYVAKHGAGRTTVSARNPASSSTGQSPSA